MKIANLGIVASAFCLAAGAAFASQVDANLFATFSTGDHKAISMSVCGGLPESNGCYGGGELNPHFEYACAVLTGAPNYHNGVVTRDIYVLDRRNSKKNAVRFYVYQRKDKITQDEFDSISVTLTHTIALPIKGGPGAKCTMAANKTTVYAGTTVDTSAVSIDKANFSTGLAGGIDPPAPLVSITSDDRGYVALHFEGGFYVIGPAGEDGGGAADLVGQYNAWVPK